MRLPKSLLQTVAVLNPHSFVRTTGSSCRAEGTVGCSGRVTWGSCFGAASNLSRQASLAFLIGSAYTGIA